MERVYSCTDLIGRIDSMFVRAQAGSPIKIAADHIKHHLKNDCGERISERDYRALVGRVIGHEDFTAHDNWARGLIQECFTDNLIEKVA